MPTTINIEVSVASFPEGFQGTPQEFADVLVENMIFTASGSFLVGQIGGVQPTTDVGIFISSASGVQEVQLWDEDQAKYVPAYGVPIGAALPFFGTGAAPLNYVYCDNAEYAKVGTYADLYAVIGDEHKRSGDSADNFRVPDMRGRGPVGNGVGQTGILGDGVGAGVITERNVGDYFGTEWGTLKQTTQPGAATGRITYQTRPPGSLANNTSYYSGVNPPSTCCAFIIRYR
jgi:microcystin-dependent protein